MLENIWILEHFSEYFIKIFHAYNISKHTLALPVKALVVVSIAELCETKDGSCPGKPDGFKRGKLPKPEKKKPMYL